MKRVIAIVLMMVLSACAGMYGKDSKPERNKLTQTPANKSDLDEAYMGRVEHQAIQRGIKVMWVNPPKAAKPKKAG
jgi:hypothetical protein